MSRTSRIPPPPKAQPAGPAKATRDDPRAVASRPSFLDFLFLLGGVGLSVYLMQIAPIRAETTSSGPAGDLIRFLPSLMRLPEGVILCWPLFFVTQWPGRAQGLTLGEWLFLLAWVGVALLTGFSAWEHLAGLPASFQAHAGKPRVLWYVVVMPAMAALAVLFLVVSLFRPAPPWTHNLGLALVVWPVAPALTVLSLGKFVAP